MAGFMDTVTGALGNLAGDLPKAVLFVRKYDGSLTRRLSQKEIDDSEKAAHDAVEAMEFKQTEGGPSIEAQKEAAYQDSLQMFQNAGRITESIEGLNKAQSKLNEQTPGISGSQNFKKMQEAAGAHYLAMEVQYNPSSIYIETAQGEREINDGGLDNIANNQIRQFRSEAVTNLSFTLVFDAMNQMDAFGLDASLLSTGGALALGKSFMENKGATAEGFTVRTKVEGLIAALFSPVTRKMMFCWAGMIFPGDLLQVNAKYTMFNKIGNPIRATVDITLQQGKEDLLQEQNSAWGKAFTKVFGEKGANAVVGGASKWDQAKNNALLNFSL